MKEVAIGNLYQPAFSESMAKLLETKGLSGEAFWKILNLEEARKATIAKMDVFRLSLVNELCNKDEEGKNKLHTDNGNEFVSFTTENTEEYNRRWAEFASSTVELSPLTKEDLAPALAQMSPREVLNLGPVVG